MSPSVQHVEVRHGAYHDSVTLMSASRQVAGVDGVATAQAAMATTLNLDVLAALGFEVPADAGPSDLVVAVRADDEAAVHAALARLEEVLSARETGGTDGEEEPPRTVGAALRREPAGLALISVPGPSAFVEAVDAVRGGASVMVFSDNVPVEQEIALKDEAARRDVLVMGPDCGTAVVAGIGLGFANVVEPGPVSLVAASGTGAQHLMALLDAAGVGVRHCLGLGGRDLSAAVGGRSARQALRALAEDEGTELVVLVSKPADPRVVASLEAEAAALGLDVVWATLGPGRPDLTAAAEGVLSRLGRPAPSWPEWPAATGGPAGSATGRALRGLFCGGTLCDEAMVEASALLGPVRSNIPLDPGWALAVDGSAAWDAGDAHAMVDFGDDALTQGRAHPMIDPSLRQDRLAREAADPRVGAVLLDVVLGHGSHPDPAGDLAPAVAAARRTAAEHGRDLAVVVSLTGTRGDPQGLERQAKALADAGAHVHLSNAHAARHAAALVGAGTPTAPAATPGQEVTR